jgi:YD repeat-containing protein
METYFRFLRTSRVVGSARHCIALLAILSTCRIWALTSGPAMPEYNDFESIEHKDMVNLATGEFTYTVPITNVPGPGTAFPIVLGYHGNILAKQEASWVGLGWNVQAGAITRSVNRVPDDFAGDLVKEEMKSFRLHSWFYSVTIDEWTVGISNNSEEGVGGIVEYSPMGANAGAARIGGHLGLGSMAGMGVGVSYPLAAQTGRATVMGMLGVSTESGFDFGMTAESKVGDGMVGMGVSTSQGASISASYKSMGTSLSGGGLGLSYSAKAYPIATSLKARYTDNSFAFSILVPFTVEGKPHQVGGNISKADYKIDGLEEDRYYGFLYTDQMGCQATELCSNTDEAYAGSTNGNRVRKMEVNQGSRPYEDMNGAHAYIGAAAQDVYEVGTEGISGGFQPYRTEDGDYFTYFSKKKFTFTDPTDWRLLIPLCDGCAKDTKTFDFAPILETGKTDLNSPNLKWRELHSRHDAMVWKYSGDQGGALYTNPNGSRTERYSIFHASRKVQPYFKGKKIAGWTITRENGMRYLFTERQQNFAQLTSASDDFQGDKWTRQDLPSFDYAWLLTAVLSPDYVKQGTGHSCTVYDPDVNGTAQTLCLPRDGDFGGWVRMNYTPKEKYYWRAPYQALAGQVTEVGDQLYPTRYLETAGVKSVGFLESIETATHKAIFVTGNRLDGKGLFPHDFHYASVGSLSAYPQAQLRLLSRIDLVSKVFGSKVVSSTRFDYDYSLAKSTVNSSAPGNGRLTLLAVRQGGGPTGPWLPPYRFKYGPNLSSPPDADGGVDMWGYSCSACGASQTRPDGTFAPWGLVQVKDPAGGEMNVEYEPNRIVSIGDKPIIRPPNYDYSKDFAIKSTFGPMLEGFTYKKMLASTQTQLKTWYTVLLGVSEGEKHHLYQVKNMPLSTSPEKYLVEFHGSAGAHPMVMADRTMFLRDRDELRYCILPVEDTELNRLIDRSGAEFLPLADADNGYKVWSASDLPYGVGLGQFTSGHEFDLFPVCADGWVDRRLAPTYLRVWGLYSSNPETNPNTGFSLAGGSRVHRVRMKDVISGRENSIRYDYYAGNTPILPRSNTRIGTEFYSGSETGDELLTGNPGVLYGKVIATQEKIGYQSEYRFITSFDAPVIFSLFGPNKKDGSVIANVDSKVEVLDRSALWGRLWKSIERDIHGAPVRTIVSKWAQNWNLTDELLSGPPATVTLDNDGAPFQPVKEGMLVRPSFQSDINAQKKYFGITQEIYGIRNFGFNNQGAVCNTGEMFNLESCLNLRGQHTTQIGRYRVLPYSYETVETIDGVAQTSRYSNYDYLTGGPLVSITGNGPGQFDAMATTLAYQLRSSDPVYQSMFDRNMLTQEFSGSRFRFAMEPSEKDFGALGTVDLAKVASASASRWYDYGGGVIRKRESIDMVDKAGFVIPTLTSILDPLKWISTGINSIYDDFGNLVEFKDPQGNSTAEIFAYGKTVPSAYVTNSKINQVFHQSFETDEHLSSLVLTAGNHGLSSSRSWTGKKSLKVSNCLESVNGIVKVKPECPGGSSYSMVCMKLPDLDVNQTYLASAMFYDEFVGSNPDSPTDPVYRAKPTQVTRPGMFIGVPGIPGCAEEIHPNGAQLDVAPSTWVTPAGNNDWHAGARSVGKKAWNRIWTQYRPGPSCSATDKLQNAMICLYASKNVAGSDVFYDEVRVRPANSLMQTMAYDAKGNVISTADANETVTHYEYDKFGNLSGIRDQDGRLLSEQAKRNAPSVSNWTVNRLPNFIGACQEIELTNEAGEAGHEFHFEGAVPANAATLNMLTGRNGRPAPFLCNQNGNRFDIKLTLRATGRTHSFTIVQRAINDIVINGCDDYFPQGNQVLITSLTSYTGACKNLQTTTPGVVPFSTHFGVRLPTKTDLEGMGMSQDDHLLGYRIRFDFPPVASPLEHAVSSEYPPHLQYNWFNDLSTFTLDPSYDGQNFRAHNPNGGQGSVLLGREYTLVKGGAASLGNVCENYDRIPAEKVYTKTELGMVGDFSQVTDTKLNTLPNLLVFALYGDAAPATTHGFWPYIFGSLQNAHASSNIKIVITPITEQVPNPSQGISQCAQ